MQRYLVRRLILIVPVVLGVTVFVFCLIHLAPGDPVVLMLGKFYDPSYAADQRHALGLDRPLSVQYVLWLSNIARGDLGRSITQSNGVAALLGERLPTTMLLAVGAMGVALAIAIPLGVTAAVRAGALADHVSRLAAMVGVSMPIFWLGLLLIIVFSLQLGWLPPGGSVDEFGWQALILPCVALGTSFAALAMRITRSSMLEALREDYIRTARAKGVAASRVVYFHALRNALVPIITVIGLQFGTVLSGTVLTETVFNIPGMGRLLVEAISGRDYPLLQGTILVTSLLYVLVNLAVDLLYAACDPRIRYG
ncbi:MAG TPA: ABC transporter permease [bacterium]|nr:ABC transporter permease [bacterium]